MCRIAQRTHNYNKSVLVPNGGRGIWESGDLARRNPPGDDSLVQRLIRSVGTTRIYDITIVVTVVQEMRNVREESSTYEY